MIELVSGSRISLVRFSNARTAISSRPRCSPPFLWGPAACPLDADLYGQRGGHSRVSFFPILLLGALFDKLDESRLVWAIADF